MEFTPDKETMRSFLGMINYLNRSSVLSAHLAAPLSSLTHQATDYKPGKVHLENFQRLKMEISNMKALPYFNTSAETTLQMDASKKGLGACLIQNGKVVCYVSRALTKTVELSELGTRGTRNYMGNGKIPLFPVWQGIHTGNRSKATCKYIQEAHG